MSLSTDSNRLRPTRARRVLTDRRQGDDRRARARPRAALLRLRWQRRWRRRRRKKPDARHDQRPLPGAEGADREMGLRTWHRRDDPRDAQRQAPTTRCGRCFRPARAKWTSWPATSPGRRSSPLTGGSPTSPANSPPKNGRPTFPPSSNPTNGRQDLRYAVLLGHGVLYYRKDLLEKAGFIVRLRPGPRCRRWRRRSWRRPRGQLRIHLHRRQLRRGEPARAGVHRQCRRRGLERQHTGREQPASNRRPDRSALIDRKRCFSGGGG